MISQCQREAIEPPADLVDHLAVGGGAPAASDVAGRGPVEEQLDGGAVGKRLEGEAVLAPAPQRLAAGRQHRDPWAGRHERLGQLGRRLEHMLAVVQHDEQLARHQRRDQRVEGGALGLLVNADGVAAPVL